MSGSDTALKKAMDVATALVEWAFPRVGSVMFAKLYESLMV